MTPGRSLKIDVENTRRSLQKAFIKLKSCESSVKKEKEVFDETFSADSLLWNITLSHSMYIVINRAAMILNFHLRIILENKK